jgi:AraC-like DNA-binding protein
MKFTYYLTCVRIYRAKFMMRHHPALTVDEAALSCGFSDTGYFCRVFKRRTKLTPTEYRIRGEEQRSGGGETNGQKRTLVRGTASTIKRA